jgi:hypothetical protein
MLYAPRIDPKPLKLQLSKFARNFSMQPIRSYSRIFDCSSSDYEYIDYPLHIMLSRFGRLIPESRFDRITDIAPPSEWIVTQYVCYQTLHQVTHVEIERVDTLGLHLEFDYSRKVLNIFRFPSFCRLMYDHTTSTAIER